MVSGLVLLALSAVSIPDTGQPGGGPPRLEVSEARRSGDHAAVSFRLANVLGAEALEQMRSGVPVVFRHRVEVLARRSAAPWPSKRHASMHIVTSAVFDSLTQRYELSRTIDLGNRHGLDSSPLEERSQTDSIERMRVWMTEFDQLPVLQLPETTRDSQLRVRVRSTLGRHYIFFLFPARISVSAERGLEP